MRLILTRYRKDWQNRHPLVAVDRYNEYDRADACIWARTHNMSPRMARHVQPEATATALLFATLLFQRMRFSPFRGNNRMTRSLVTESAVGLGVLCFSPVHQRFRSALFPLTRTTCLGPTEDGKRSCTCAEPECSPRVTEYYSTGLYDNDPERYLRCTSPRLRRCRTTLV